MSQAGEPSQNLPSTFVYFGKWLKQIQVLSPDDLRDVLEARLSEDEVDEVMLTDVLNSQRW